MTILAIEQTRSNMRRYAELVSHLVCRDFDLRYTGSVLGVLWSVLLPLSQLIVLVFVFERVVPLSIEAYPAFVFSALLPWAWFSSSLGTAGSLFMTHRDLVRRPHFEPATVVVMNTVSNFLMYLAGLPLLVLTVFLYGRLPTGAYLLLPVLILLQALLTIGLSLMAATWNVFYRDMQHIVTVALSLWFYLTPVFYELPPESAAATIFLMVNPMALLVHSHRQIVFEGQTPALAMLLLTTFWCVLLLLLGSYIYRRHHERIVDEL
jgi:lipopolysaccharide transport system permease protein